MTRCHVRLLRGIWRFGVGCAFVLYGGSSCGGFLVVPINSAERLVARNTRLIAMRCVLYHHCHRMHNPIFHRSIYNRTAI